MTDGKKQMHPRMDTYRMTLALLHSQLPRLLPGAVRRIPDQNAVAVTIDDGPTGEGTMRILEHCASLGMKITFFFSGEQMQRFPDPVREAAMRGHGIAIHGWRHISPLRFRGAEFIRDLKRSANAIENLTGRHPEWYRPPYGRMHPAQLRRAVASGYRVALWSLMPGDWYPAEASAGVRRRLDRMRGGDIIVLHERPGPQHRLMDLLSFLAEHCERRGLSFHTLETGI